MLDRLAFDWPCLLGKPPVIFVWLAESLPETSVEEVSLPRACGLHLVTASFAPKEAIAYGPLDATSPPTIASSVLTPVQQGVGSPHRFRRDRKTWPIASSENNIAFAARDSWVRRFTNPCHYRPSCPARVRRRHERFEQRGGRQWECFGCYPA